MGIENENRRDEMASELGVDFRIPFSFRMWRKNPPSPHPKSATEIAINA